MRGHRVPFLLGAVLIAHGCGSGDDSKSAGEDFWSKYGDIYCPGAKRCCEAKGSEHDVGACREFFSVLGAFGSSGQHYDAAAAEQCLSELQTAIEQCAPEPDSCDRVFSGSKQVGESCKSEDDCMASTDGAVNCYHDGSSEDGTCRLTPTPAEGQPCGPDSDTATEHYACETDPTLYCDSVAKLCKKRVAVGQACKAFECVPDADCVSGTCTAQAAVGEDCAAKKCVSSAYCDSATQNCVAKKNLGEACSSPGECMDYCSNGKCVASGLAICITNN